MVTIGEYVSALTMRLGHAGVPVREAEIGSAVVLVAEFDQPQWLGRLHYCITVRTAELATEWLVRDHALRSAEYGKQLDLPGRGWTNAVLNVAAVVAQTADDAARHLAATEHTVALGASSRILLVELASRQIHTSTRTPIWGALGEPKIKRTLAGLFPPPLNPATIGPL